MPVGLPTQRPQFPPGPRSGSSPRSSVAPMGALAHIAGPSGSPAGSRDVAARLTAGHSELLPAAGRHGRDGGPSGLARSGVPARGHVRRRRYRLRPVLRGGRVELCLFGRRRRAQGRTGRTGRLLLACLPPQRLLGAALRLPGPGRGHRSGSALQPGQACCLTLMQAIGAASTGTRLASLHLRGERGFPNKPRQLLPLLPRSEAVTTPTSIGGATARPGRRRQDGRYTRCT